MTRPVSISYRAIALGNAERLTIIESELESLIAQNREYIEERERLVSTNAMLAGMAKRLLTENDSLRQMLAQMTIQKLNIMNYRPPR